jgi:pyruvate kinase
MGRVKGRTGEVDQVPLVQKRACELARRQAKPVIVATQVLESMIENSRPTRAEASDAANAVLDGADALMLSGETSVGKHPFAAVQTMARIIENTEDHGLHRIRPLGTRPNSKGGAVTAAAAEIGELLGCKYLITFTTSGDSTRRLSRVRPRIPMLAFTPNQWTRSQLALTWGVETFLVDDARHTDEMAMQVDEVLLAAGRVVEGDNVIIVAGSPPGIPGSTNALRIHRMGDAINEVTPAYRRRT